MKTSNISQGRLGQEVRNMNKERLPYLFAQPLENDLYNWHFTIQGPEDTDFHEGIYHGQILLPYEYPFKPPDIVFMNKNGRFETNKKICLTFTQYHPEEWNSAWTIRTMLEAVISFFNENALGFGAEEASPELRRHHAIQSHSFRCEKCGPIRDILKPRTASETNRTNQTNQREKLEKCLEQRDRGEKRVPVRLLCPSPLSQSSFDHAKETSQLPLTAPQKGKDTRDPYGQFRRFLDIRHAQAATAYKSMKIQFE